MPDSFIEAHLRAAVESAPSGLLMADAAGRILLVNREIERLFGYSRDELLGQPVECLIPSRFRERHPAARGEMSAGTHGRPMGSGRDLVGQRKDGSDVPIEIGLTPIATDDGRFVVASIVDLTERKRLEQEQRALAERLRQAQKMQAIGTLSGGIAHDFNNILAAIIGYAEIMAADLGPDSAAAADAQEILAAALRGRRLTGRILTFSRRSDAERRPVDLSEVVREVKDLLRATLSASIKLQMHSGNAIPLVLADSTAVHQVVMNLASNAAQAMPNGGALDLGVARTNPALHEGRYVAIDVRDNGTGMDADTRARAFEPFFTTKPIGSGTGLGLALVHGIMHDHGGTVLLDSEIGVGTQVRCLFPVPAGLEAVEADPFTPMSRGQGEMVLLVDDEPRLLEVTARRLTVLGYKVQSFTRPAAALSAFRAEPGAFDLVITDLSMPEMTGPDLAASIRRLRANIPIILLSGLLDRVTKDSLRAAGIGSVLQKPAVQAELARACRAALDGTATGPSH
jgi:PAS domain S-box-containing protein